MNATQIIELLRHRHPPGEWAIFTELSEGTGARAGGRIDFYAMHLWPSKRYLKIAYEIKVSRGDFMRELDNPRKRAKAEAYADECYFVAPAKLLGPDEMPEKWGLIEADHGGLKVKKRASQKEVTALPLEFVAALARRASEPPSTLPEVFWRYAGEELTQEQLLQAAQKNLADYLNQKRFEVIAEFKKGEEYQRLLKVLRIVEQEISPRALYNPDTITAWINDHRQGMTDKKTADFLARLKRDLDVFLSTHNNETITIHKIT